MCLQHIWDAILKANNMVLALKNRREGTGSEDFSRKTSASVEEVIRPAISLLSPGFSQMTCVMPHGEMSSQGRFHLFSKVTWDWEVWQRGVLVRRSGQIVFPFHRWVTRETSLCLEALVPCFVKSRLGCGLISSRCAKGLKNKCNELGLGRSTEEEVLTRHAWWKDGVFYGHLAHKIPESKVWLPLLLRPFALWISVGL